MDTLKLPQRLRRLVCRRDGLAGEEEAAGANNSGQRGGRAAGGSARSQPREARCGRVSGGCDGHGSQKGRGGRAKAGPGSGGGGGGGVIHAGRDRCGRGWQAAAGRLCGSRARVYGVFIFGRGNSEEGGGHVT